MMSILCRRQCFRHISISGACDLIISEHSHAIRTIFYLLADFLSHTSYLGFSPRNFSCGICRHGSCGFLDTPLSYRSASKLETCRLLVSGATQVHHGALHRHCDEEQRAVDVVWRGDGRDHQQRRLECQERGDRLRVDHSLDQPRPKQSSKTHRQAATLHQTWTAQHSVLRRNRQGY